jgi:hypothetical protein
MPHLMASACCLSFHEHFRLYPLHSRHKGADSNAAYLGDGSRVKLVAFFGARLNHGAVCRSLQRVRVAYQCGCYHSCATPGEFTVSDQVQFVASHPAGILRQVRFNPDLRKRAFADRDAFSRRRIRPSGGV